MNIIAQLCMIQDQAQRFFGRPIELKIHLNRCESDDLWVTIETGMPYAEGKAIADRMDNEWLFAHMGAFCRDITVDYKHIYPEAKKDEPTPESS